MHTPSKAKVAHYSERSEAGTHEPIKHSTSRKIDFAIGGQAVVEGVMMRSPNHIVISVRKQDKSIKVQQKPYKTLTQKFKYLNIPIIRGVINLFEMMAVGFQAINFSANEYAEQSEGVEPAAKSPKSPRAPKPSTSQKLLEAITMLISFVLAIAFSIFLFKFLPLWITTFLETKSEAIKNNYILFNLIDGALKTSFFIFYIYFLTLFKSFRRIFEYHGAEHKSIFAYEKSLPLTVANAKKQSRFHPRCGTSFILIVFVISIIVYTLVPKEPDFIKNLMIRLAFLPLIAGVSYEYLKISARYSKNKFTQLFVAPGLWLQRLTTKEPSNDQLEVALNSLKIALKREEKIKGK
jgi:uncharacterized protein YqhQ